MDASIHPRVLLMYQQLTETTIEEKNKSFFICLFHQCLIQGPSIIARNTLITEISGIIGIIRTNRIMGMVGKLGNTGVIEII